MGTKRRDSDSGGYWGLCPECEQEPIFIHVRKNHYATCPTHRTAWFVGYNLMTTYCRWDDDELVHVYGHDDRERITAEAAAELSAYREVKPVYRRRPTDPRLWLHVCNVSVHQDCAVCGGDVKANEPPNPDVYLYGSCDKLVCDPCVRRADSRFLQERDLLRAPQP